MTTKPEYWDRSTVRRLTLVAIYLDLGLPCYLRSSSQATLTYPRLAPAAARSDCDRPCTHSACYRDTRVEPHSLGRGRRSPHRSTTRLIRPGCFRAVRPSEHRR